jgi:hypothetical protein
VIAIVIALVAAGGSYLGVSLTSGGIPTSGLTTLWTGNHLASGCGSTSSNVPWTDGDLAVACSGRGVAAYRLGTGQVAWAWQPPSSPGPSSLAGPQGQQGKAFLSILQMSTGTSDGIGVVEYTYGASVTYLAGIQVATGRELWHVSNVNVDDGATIWASDGRFAVIVDTSKSADAARVYSLTSGALDWSSAARGVPARGCGLNDLVISGTSVYAVATCSATGSLPRDDQLYQLGLVTGSAQAHAALQDITCPAKTDSPTLWAVPGYLLSGCSGAPPSDSGPDVVVIPSGGVTQNTLSYKGSPQYLNFLSTDLEPGELAAYGTTLYLENGITLGSGSSDYFLADIDLGTATLRWEKPVSVPGEAANSTAYHPLNLIGATAQGALDLIENVNSNSGDLTGTTGLTLAVLSASDGALTYGPGTTDSDGVDDQPAYTLIGRTLLAVPLCVTIACGEDGVETAAVAAYGTGSWPG